MCVGALKKKKRWQYPRQMKSVFTSDLFVKSAQRIYGPWLHWEVTMRVQDHRNSSCKPLHLNLHRAFKLHQHRLTNLAWDGGRLATQIGQIQSGNKAAILLTKRLMFKRARCSISSDVFERLYCMNHETAEREKQMNNYLILGRSHLEPFFFNFFLQYHLLQSPSHWLSTSLTWGGGGRYQTLNSIFHSWANHVLFQQ